MDGSSSAQQASWSQQAFLSASNDKRLQRRREQDRSRRASETTEQREDQLRKRRENYKTMAKISQARPTMSYIPLVI